MPRRKPPTPQSLASYTRSGATGRLLKRVREHQDVLALVRRELPVPLRDHCIYAMLENGALSLFVDSPAWASKMHFHGPRLVADLSRSRLAARRFKVRILPRQANPRPMRRPARRPTPETAQSLAAAATSLGDTHLSASLKRLFHTLSTNDDR